MQKRSAATALADVQYTVYTTKCLYDTRIAPIVLRGPEPSVERGAALKNTLL